MKLSERCFKAAAYIEEHGWVRGVSYAEGRVCLAGAVGIVSAGGLGAAAWPQHGSAEERECFRVLHDIAVRLRPGEYTAPSEYACAISWNDIDAEGPEDVILLLKTTGAWYEERDE
jgi:hypothetical protein